MMHEYRDTSIRSSVKSPKMFIRKSNEDMKTFTIVYLEYVAKIVSPWTSLQYMHASAMADYAIPEVV